MVTKNANFFCVVFRVFFEKVVFLKMGGAGIKWGPCPPILCWFFMKFNKEDLLKVSLKNLHPFKSKKIQNILLFFVTIL